MGVKMRVWIRGEGRGKDKGGWKRERALGYT